eukprot:scaffold591_cov372-Prasinococcus_capsulatus_cf.AAC.15
MREWAAFCSPRRGSLWLPTLRAPTARSAPPAWVATPPQAHPIAPDPPSRYEPVPLTPNRLGGLRQANPCST